MLVGKLGERLANSSLGVMLKELAKKAKINKNVHPHTLRKTRGQHILEATGGDMLLTSKKLGHKKLETTQLSYADFSPEQAEKLLEKKIEGKIKIL